MPESLRIRAQLCTPLYIRPGQSSGACIPGGTEGAPSATAATTTAPVPVRTKAASETTTLLGAQVLNAARDPDNPDRRFQQYFPETPPAPLSKICPERYPNPAPPTRDRFCVQATMFAPSVPTS